MARLAPARRPIAAFRLARHERRARAALLAGLRSGVGAALIRLSPAEAVILARLEAACCEFFEAPTAAKAEVSADMLRPAIGPLPVRLGWRRPV